jgi:hypothetical protein
MLALVTADKQARCCPGCGVRSECPHSWTRTRPRDLPVAGRRTELTWTKRRWRCRNPLCSQATFTESLPQIPPRSRLTGRLRTAIGVAVADGGRTVIQSARDHEVSWPVAQAAFAAAAQAGLPKDVPAVEHLGIDETRRGKANSSRYAPGVFGQDSGGLRVAPSERFRDSGRRGRGCRLPLRPVRPARDGRADRGTAPRRHGPPGLRRLRRGRDPPPGRGLDARARPGTRTAGDRRPRHVQHPLPRRLPPVVRETAARHRRRAAGGLVRRRRWIVDAGGSRWRSVRWSSRSSRRWPSWPGITDGRRHRRSRPSRHRALQRRPVRPRRSIRPRCVLCTWWLRIKGRRSSCGGSYRGRCTMSRSSKRFRLAVRAGS